MTPDAMEKFELRVAYSLFGISHSMRILCKAVNDDEVIRAGFVLADMLEYQRAENAVIHVVGSQERDIATFGQSEDVDSIDRPVTYGSGYRPQAARS